MQMSSRRDDGGTASWLTADPRLLFSSPADILKKFNPSVKGFSRGQTQRQKGFNMAMAGAKSSYVGHHILPISSLFFIAPMNVNIEQTLVSIVLQGDPSASPRAHQSHERTQGCEEPSCLVSTLVVCSWGSEVSSSRPCRRWTLKMTGNSSPCTLGQATSVLTATTKWVSLKKTLHVSGTPIHICAVLLSAGELVPAELHAQPHAWFGHVVQSGGNFNFFFLFESDDQLQLCCISGSCSCTIVVPYLYNIRCQGCWWTLWSSCSWIRWKRWWRAQLVVPFFQGIFSSQIIN